MITKIEVNGFRSLNDFKISIKPGLNILVGPNGSGKTNIISFFEFLSQVVTGGLFEAFGRQGGAGSVFSKNGETNYCQEMGAVIYGSVETDSAKFVHYEYGFSVRAGDGLDSIYFSQQSLKLSKGTNESLSTASNILDIQQNFESGKRIVHKVNELEQGLLEHAYISISKKRKIAPKQFQEILDINSDNTTCIILSLFPFISLVRNILMDLKGGEVFNIVPLKAKAPEDASSVPGMNKDGSGLSSTLYAMKHKRDIGENSRRGRFFPVRFARAAKAISIEEVIKHLTTANRSIKKIDVLNDPFDNLLKVRVWIEGEREATVLPLSAMSDGTVKWLALVTAVLTSKTIFSIEEPENFLHPLMQAEVVKLMRNMIASRGKGVSVIMTTHSETILNNSRPDDVIIVSFKNGRTHASRCTNSEDLSKEIQETGFGLGYYYLSGSISNE